jgi:DNA repair photolyase
MLRREVPLVSQPSDVTVSFSIGTLDRAVWRLTEPGTPHPMRRVEAVGRLSESGVRTGVIMAPLLPGLSDHPDQVAAVEKACREAGAESVAPIRLHLRPGVKEHFMEWLGENRPDLVERYGQMYRGRSYLKRAGASLRLITRWSVEACPGCSTGGAPLTSARRYLSRGS